MRTTRLHGLTALLLALALTACGKDATEPGVQGNGDARMSARIDGQTWSASLALAAGGSQAGAVVAVSGSDQAQRTIAFAFVSAGTGTYEIGPGAPTNALFSQGSAQWQAAGGQGSGTITVTTLTAERIAGTFEFTAEPAGGGATGTRVVTQGTFDVEF